MAGKIWRQQYKFSFCPLPLAYIETWMPHLTPNAHVLYTVIARATWGWHKETDVLAHAELRRRSGLPDKSLRRAINELRGHGLLKTEGPMRHPLAYTLQFSRLMQLPGTVIVTAPKVLLWPK